MAGIAGVNQEFMDHLKKGDPRCSYPLESRVIKMDSEKNDLHEPGKQGIVKGNIYMNSDGIVLEGYLVLFDGDPAETFLMKEKIILL